MSGDADRTDDEDDGGRDSSPIRRWLNHYHQIRTQDLHFESFRLHPSQAKDHH